MADATTTTTTDTAAATAAAMAAAAATAAANAATPWYQGKADQETVGHWDNKGWKKDDPIEIAIQATKQARELQKHFGVPETQLLKLPAKADDEAGWKAVHARLGVPAEAKEYDLSTIAFKNGEKLDDAAVDALRNVLSLGRVPKERAAETVKAIVALADAEEASEVADRTAALQAERGKLQKDWGANFEFNKLTAMQGAKRLGVTPETVAKLESEVGYAAVMEMFRKIGAGTNEDTFVQSGVGGSITTQSGAVARKAELMTDRDWASRYLKGGVAERREMDNLNMIISGEAA